MHSWIASPIIETGLFLSALGGMTDSTTLSIIGIGVGIIGTLITIAISLIAYLRPLKKMFEELKEVFEELKKSAVHEKTAIMWAYANNVHRWENEGLDAEIIANRIISDMRAIGSMKVDEVELSYFGEAVTKLKEQLEKEGYNKEAKRIDDRYRDIFQFQQR